MCSDWRFILILCKLARQPLDHKNNFWVTFVWPKLTTIATALARLMNQFNKIINFFLDKWLIRS